MQLTENLIDDTNIVAYATCEEKTQICV